MSIWCDRCGRALADGGHEPCNAARALEPPRYCGQCRRRMKVQVLPAGWRATCVEHGDLRSQPVIVKDPGRHGAPDPSRS